MMIYFGQELGEPGTDTEGFSGFDGRTTIFDYWSVASVRRWLGKGTARGRLTGEEKELRAKFRKVLNLANSEKAIAEGAFFDLMYVNLDNPRLNPHRHFAFLRYTEDDVLLIVANFDNSDSYVAVNIPVHAFQTIDFPQGVDRKAQELLTGEKAEKKFVIGEPVEVKVPAHGAAIWKLQRRNIKPLKK